MEALIIAIAALAVLVVIDAGYWIAISLVRWSPVMAAGVIADWLSHHYGAQTLDALAIALLGSILVRHVMLTRFTSGGGNFHRY